MIIRKNLSLKKDSTAIGTAVPAGIFLFAFLLRFLYIYQSKSDFSSECLVVDLKYYNNWALRILKGDWLGGSEVFEMTPLYAYFLAFIYKFISTKLFIVRLIQIIIGSASCAVLYKITKDVLNNKLAGALASLAAAVYGPFIFYDGMIMKPFLEVFFVLAMTLFLLNGGESKFLFPLLAGVCLGLAALLRENVILLIPVIPIWLLLSGRSEGRGLKFSSAAGFLVGAFIIIFPVTTRNYYVAGELVPVTSGGGEVFYIGNNPEADGTYIQPKFVRPAPETEHEDFRRKARELTGRNLSRKEASDFWLDQGMKFIKENPGSFIKLLARKFILFWNFYEFPDSQNYYFQRTQSNILGGPLLHFGVVGPIGLLGIILALRRPKKFAVLLLFFFTYLVSILIFFNFARFRILAVPFLIIFGVYAVWWMKERIQEKSAVHLLISSVFLAGLYFASNYNMTGKDPYKLKFDTAYSNLGACYAEAGKMQEAYDFFKKSLDVNPGYTAALVGVGNIFFQAGKPDIAEKAYKSAIKENPSAGGAYNGLGNIFSARNQYDFAIEAFSKAVEIEPDNPGYITNLGFALNGKRLFPEALNAYQRSLRVKPDFADSYYGLAMTSENMGQYDRAATYWMKFLNLSQDERWKEQARERFNRLKAITGSSGTPAASPTSR